MPIQATPQLVAAAIVVLIAVALERFPALKTRWDSLSADAKAGTILGLCLVAPFVPVVLACAGVHSAVVATCPGPPDVAQVLYNDFLLGLTAFTIATAQHDAGDYLQAIRATAGVASRN
jgi:hypothetical protein